MRIHLSEADSGKATVVLTAPLPASNEPACLDYETATGALVRVDGRAAGAFDREHGAVEIGPAPNDRVLALEVERYALPTNLLPSGPGLWWRFINFRGRQKPSTSLELSFDHVYPERGERSRRARDDKGIPIWGHSHLDVAWLWTYASTKRRAMRTFANMASYLESDSDFVFIQSQPQLYEFVRECDAELFGRIAGFAREGRFDSDVAALWVEPDCNVPSGESLLRQMLAAHAFCTEHFGVAPSIAWLPDSFGFARTLPTLLGHAGIPYFATTKLQWNDTTRFPYPQFVWRGPDGAEIVSAMIDRYEGGPGTLRARVARERHEPLVIGYGDGGGGPTREQLVQASGVGRWERPRAWFDRLASRRSDLPVHDDELYLEYHRGVYTTHHDVKAGNAELERRLRHAEEQAAWCVAVRAQADAVARISASLREAWHIVLRNQFHDVLPGTSIEPVYDDLRSEYEHAAALVEAAEAAAAAMLPRAARTSKAPQSCPPVERDGDYDFTNEYLRARVAPSGALLELQGPHGRNVVAQANLLAIYRDRPKRWEAWNIDAGYERSGKAAVPQPPSIVDAGLEIPFRAGNSAATMRVALSPREPFLRVDVAIDWRNRRRLLRVENWLAVSTESVTYGAPHGIVTRTARKDTPQRKAQFEVPGQRFACVRDAAGNGIAMFSLDGYGWSARALDKGGIALGHSLLRGTTWPDPNADLGQHELHWAYAPLSVQRVADVERLWSQFAGGAGVALFESGEPAIIVVACKPAEDGNGVIVRVRECEGAAGAVRLRCGARMRTARAVDALERDCEGEARIEGETLFSTIGGYGLRSFRVTF